MDGADFERTSSMEMKEAIIVAKAYLADAFDGEAVNSFRLEEVEFKENEREWLITLGLYRPNVSNPILGFSPITAPLKKTYKVVRVSDDLERALSVKNRESSED